MRTRPNRLPYALVPFLFALLLTACSGGSGGGEADGDAGGAAAPSDAGAMATADAGGMLVPPSDGATASPAEDIGGGAVEDIGGGAPIDPMAAAELVARLPTVVEGNEQLVQTFDFSKDESMTGFYRYHEALEAWMPAHGKTWADIRYGQVSGLNFEDDQFANLEVLRIVGVSEKELFDYFLESTQEEMEGAREVTIGGRTVTTWDNRYTKWAQFVWIEGDILFYISGSSPREAGEAMIAAIN